jgi:hypothetical protein
MPQRNRRNGLEGSGHFDVHAELGMRRILCGAPVQGHPRCWWMTHGEAALEAQPGHRGDPLCRQVRAGAGTPLPARGRDRGEDGSGGSRHRLSNGH